MPKSSLKKSTLVATTAEEFLKIVEDCRKEWDHEDGNISYIWFRGHQKKNWRLIPSIFRIGRFQRETEDDIREEFAIRAPGLSRHEPLPESEWNFLFLMQHYGAPTRLLDWTESPTISLYFALRDNPGYFDSAIWILDPYELNGRVLGQNEVIAPSATGTNPKDSKKVAPWLPDRWTKSTIPDWPIAIFPTHIARRISSQKSCFTIHGQREDGFSQFSGGTSPCLKRVVLPARNVRSILAEIRDLGIDDTTVFPDLEGLGRSLVTRYQAAAKDLPHRGVYVRLGPSKITRGGVGIFAITRIPKNTRLFANENEEICWKPERDIPKSPAIRKLYDEFSIIDGGFYGSPTSFNRLTPAWYMTDSRRPNTRIDDDYDFYTLREISPGEELTADFSSFSK